MQINCFEIVIMFLQNNSRVFIRLHQIAIKKTCVYHAQINQKEFLIPFR